MTARRLIDDDTGATAIEYALLAALIATVIVGAVGALGRALDDLYGNANTRLNAEIQASDGQ